MADRLQQFSMLPNGFASSLSAQGNAAQLNQQQQDPSQQSVGGLPNPEHGRMWQQMQQQMQAQQIRSGNGVPDGSQLTQQMADYMRTQGLMPGQQQRSFGLGPPGGIGLSQSPSFPDMNNIGNNLGNFNNNSNNPMSQMSAAQIQAAFQNRNNPMFQGTPPQQLNRQLELMGMAQNQQPQNGPVNMGVGRGMQPGQQQQNFQPNMGQNGQGATPLGQPFNPSGPVEHKRAALSELRDKAVHLHNSLKVVEQHQITLAGQRTGLSDSIFLQRAAVLEQDIARKRAVLTKWNMMLTANGLPPVGQVMNQMGAQNNIGQQQTENWLANQQATGTPGFNNNNQMSPNQFQAALAGQQQNLQNSTQGSPRSAPAPQQLLGQGVPNMTSPNMGAPFTMQQQQTAAAAMANSTVPALDRTRFNGSYKHFCQTKKLVLDDRLMIIQNRPVDLHLLHTAVMGAGGYQRVTSQELWSAIGGKLGFVQFPGSNTEPPRSDPQVAQRLEHVYKEYLNVFDTIYIASYVQEASKRRQQVEGGQLQGQTPQQQQMSQMQPQQPQQQQQLQPNQQQQVQKRQAEMLQYAYHSVSEMRMRGLPEPAIRFVEENRASIQKAYDAHAARGLLPPAAGQNQGLGQNLTPAQKTQMAQQMLGNMPSAAAAALANQAGYGNRQGLGVGGQVGGQGFQGGTPQNALNMAMGLTGSDAMTQQMQMHQARMAQQREQQQQQQQQGGQISPPGLSMGGQPQGIRKPPTTEDLNNAAMFVQRAKKEIMARTVPSMRLTSIPEEQKMEYNIIFENLWRLIAEVDPKMSSYAVILSEPILQKIIAIVLTCQQQRTLLASTPPKFILDLATLKRMTHQMQNSMEMFRHQVNAIQQQQQQQLQQQQQQAQQQQQHTPAQSSPAPSAHTRAPSNGSMTIPQAHPISRTPSLSHTLPPNRKKNAAPTPPQSAPTPVATAASPPSLSPKTKPRPKAKPTAKVLALKNANASASASASTNPPSPGQTIDLSVSTPAPVTPASNAATPSSDSNANAKRRREEDEPMPMQNAPSPKRVKTVIDLEDSPSAPLVKRNEEAEKIKTDEEATKFFENLIKEASGVEPQASMASDISDTLGQIFKSYTSGSDFAPSGEMAESSAMGERRAPSPSPTGTLAISDEFGAYFDFSSFAEDDSGSKAPTPDLTTASSTNPSPESNFDPAGTPFAIDLTGSDDSVGGDLRRLGMWKEIDGGEGAFYQQDNWKWDTPMPAADQPWAIFQS